MAVAKKAPVKAAAKKTVKRVAKKAAAKTTTKVAYRRVRVFSTDSGASTDYPIFLERTRIAQYVDGKVWRFVRRLDIKAAIKTSDYARVNLHVQTDMPCGIWMTHENGVVRCLGCHEFDSTQGAAIYRWAMRPSTTTKKG